MIVFPVCVFWNFIVCFLNFFVWNWFFLFVKTLISSTHYFFSDEIIFLASNFFSSVQYYLIGEILFNWHNITNIFSKSLYFLEIVKPFVDGLLTSNKSCKKLLKISFQLHSLFENYNLSTNSINFFLIKQYITVARYIGFLLFYINKYNLI